MPGGKLQRIQIIKGWVGEEGSFNQAVYDVAGSSTNGARVDPRTCEPVGAGADTLCAVWRDPDFDPTANLVEDHDAWEKVLSMQILCKNGLTFMDNAAGANRWVYNPEGCTQSITLEAR